MGSYCMYSFFCLAYFTQYNWFFIHVVMCISSLFFLLLSDIPLYGTQFVSPFPFEEDLVVSKITNKGTINICIQVFV